MLIKEISQLRDLLNHKINDNNLDEVDVLKMSEELDTLILEFYLECKSGKEEK